MGRSWRLALVGTALLVQLSGCATTGPRCGDGERPAVAELLYLGLSIPGGGAVSPDEWADFLRDVVTPRFPDGLTAWHAQGQWRSDAGQVVREASMALSLVHGGSAAEDDKVRLVMAAYKERFRQEAVLRGRSAVCVSF
jgi:hypothetical protein